MIIPLVLLVIGFILLVKGADLLVDGASSLARALGVSGLLVGLTVVALGTSMPELVVNLFAAVRGTTDIAIGNIIGSNLANVALVLGLSAMFLPLAVQRSTVWKEIPLALLAVVLVFLMANDAYFDGAATDVLGRGDGFVLLAFFVIFLYYVFGMAANGKMDIDEPPTMSRGRMAAFVAGGIAMLVLGGKLVVDSAVDIATVAGLSERIIGLTVVAIGTSLPELVTSIVAAYRNQADLAVGNIVGSNIINVFLILGVSAAITPLPFHLDARMDAVAEIFAMVMLFVFMFIGKRHVLQKWQGLSFLGFYFLYMGYVIINSVA